MLNLLFMNILPRVLLVASDDWLGISRLPRYLSRAGARVSALTSPGFGLAASSFVTERFSTEEGAAKTLESLRRHLETAARYDWIVLADDELLDLAVERRGEPWLNGLFPMRSNDPDAALALISKAAFSRAMSACGVPMPQGRLAAGAAQILAAASDVGFPVIIKPNRGSGGVGIVSANSRAELAAPAESTRGEYLVERRLEGRVGGTAVLFDRGAPAWWSSFFKVGVWPEPYGPSCRRLAFEPAGLEALLERLGPALGLHGLFGMDWILTPEQELFVIELNGRPIPLIEASLQVAQNFPDALRDFLAGRRTVRRPPPVGDAPLCHVMPQSFLLACSHRDWRLAAGLLTGLRDRTDAPWGDAGLMKKHAFRVAKAVFLKATLGRG